MLENSARSICFTIISIDSVFKIGKNYYSWDLKDGIKFCIM